MWLTAIRDHGYAGRQIRAGRDYEVRSEKDAKILQLAGLARVVKPKKAEPVRTAKIETREEMPEIEIEENTTDHMEVETSPEDQPRRRRRQYKRKDMVPE